MRSVQVALDLPTADPDTALDAVSKFERYPDLTPDVRSVVAREDSSDWEVYFRNGILRWTERDSTDPDARVITFTQEDGDFEELSGTWRFVPHGDGCRLHFDAEFDFGIPSLVGILDPVAERVMKEIIARVVVGLFPDAQVVGDDQLSRVLADASA